MARQGNTVDSLLFAAKESKSSGMKRLATPARRGRGAQSKKAAAQPGAGAKSENAAAQPGVGAKSEKAPARPGAKVNVATIWAAVGVVVVLLIAVFGWAFSVYGDLKEARKDVQEHSRRLDALDKERAGDRQIVERLTRLEDFRDSLRTGRERLPQTLDTQMRTRR